VSIQANDSASKTSSNNLNRQVGQYALAAAVAGVGLLALAQPAAGEVVVTKKTIPIPLAPRDMPHPLKISMANNGVDNFSLDLINLMDSGSDRNLTVRGQSGRDGVRGTYFFTETLLHCLVAPRSALPSPPIPSFQKDSSSREPSKPTMADSLAENGPGISKTTISGSRSRSMARPTTAGFASRLQRIQK
jgi:hypothetical protein